MALGLFVSIPNGAPAAARAVRDNWDYLMQFDEIVIMFDQDAAGRAAAQEVAELLPVGRAKIATLPMKDASDCLVAGKEKAIIEAMFQQSRINRMASSRLVSCAISLQSMRPPALCRGLTASSTASYAESVGQK